jgi:tetratricopeptide (TPR) repeat protein
VFSASNSPLSITFRALRSTHKKSFEPVQASEARATGGIRKAKYKLPSLAEVHRSIGATVYRGAIQVPKSLLTEARSRLAAGDYAGGLVLSRQAIADLQAHSTPSDEHLAFALNIQGECQRYLGQLADAMASYDSAWKHARRTNELPIQSMIASNRGIGYLSQGRTEEAIASQRIALELDLQKGESEDIAYSRHNLGAALFQGKKNEEALSEITLAIELRKGIGDWDGLLSSLTLRADILVALDRRDAAKATVLEALNLQGLISTPIGLRHPLLVLADIHSKNGDHDAALGPMFAAMSIVEQMRARSTDREAFDSRYYEYYARLIEGLLRTDNVEGALELIDQTRARVFNDHEESKQPEAGTPLTGVPLRETIAKSLRPDEALIEMWLYKGSLKTFVTDTSGVHLYQIEGALAVDTEEAVADLLSGGNLKTNSARTFNDSFLAALATHAPTLRRLYVVPHGIQFHFPLSCLRSENGRYLCQDIDISIIQSAKSYVRLRSRNHHRTDRSLVIGDPDGSLPFARNEARLVSQALGCDALIGEQATSGRVLELLRGGVFDIVHFACHYVSAASPAMSGLLMADGIAITAQRISETAFQANLVCTASCSSGLVAYSPSNDLPGFNGALLNGGTNSIISSIAPLHDKAASFFFQHFYRRHRQRREGAAEALANCQRDMIQSAEFAAPQYWAPLYFTGV